METETIEFPKDKIITFECDKIIVKGKSLETKWTDGVPLNFEDHDTLIFSGNSKTYTFKKKDKWYIITEPFFLIKLYTG